MNMLYSDSYTSEQTHSMLFKIVEECLHVDAEKIQTNKLKAQKSLASVISNVLQSEDLKKNQGNVTPSIEESHEVDVLMQYPSRVTEFNLVSGEKTDHPQKVQQLDLNAVNSQKFEQFDLPDFEKLADADKIDGSLN